MTASVLALGFESPLLLIGLAAAAIPVILHLVASVRAPQVELPTLRFLTVAMERTAKRRTIQHWLLLILRSLVLGLLAVAVAEPISRAMALWGPSHAAVVIVDTSGSMAAVDSQGPRFDRARQIARAILSGDRKPAWAALLTTTEPGDGIDLTSDLASLRARLERLKPRAQTGSIQQRLRQAARLLAASPADSKTVWIITDLQIHDMEGVLQSGSWAGLEDASIGILSIAQEPVDNVGVVDLTITGRRVAGGRIGITATIENASGAPKRARTWLMIDGQPAGPEVVRHLAAAGQVGDTATVTFSYVMPPPDQALRGGVLLADTDALAADDGRYFALDSARSVRALVVTGPTGDELPDLLQPGGMLTAALAPYGESGGPIRVAVESFGRLGVDDLAGMDAVFFCQIPRFDGEVARAVADFAQAGGVVVFFAGPGLDVDNYNRRFIQDIPQTGSLLPAQLGSTMIAQGQPTTTQWIDTRHPYFADLHDQASDYPQVLVQQWLRLDPTPTEGRTLIQLANGHPLLVVKTFGRGEVAFCAVPDTRLWSDLPLSHLFLPMVTRMAMHARGASGEPAAHPSGAHVVIRPAGADQLNADESVLQLQPPGQAARIDLIPTNGDDGLQWVVEETPDPGLTYWRVAGPNVDDRPEWRGAFAVNAAATETDLRTFSTVSLRERLDADGPPMAMVATSLVEAQDQLALERKSQNWWDVIAVVAVMVLVAEALAANIGSRSDRRGAVTRAS